MDKDSAPIFVIGTGRSGTTLLRLMLSAHPRIYISHEASFYVWEALFPKGKSRRAFLDYYFKTSSFRWLRTDPVAVLAGLPDPLPHARIGEAFRALMRTKAASYGRPRYGDKTPSHAAHLKRIYEDFPDARVIHIVRDPRATALSLSQMPWASASLAANAALCDLERQQVAPFRERVLEVRLEDLLADPRATMGRVLEFVGEPWDDRVLDHQNHLPDSADMPPLPWLESAARPRGAGKANWKTLSPSNIRMIEKVAWRSMKEGGYTRAPLEKEPSSLSVFWAWLGGIPDAFRSLAVYTRVALRMRDPKAFDAPETNDLLRRVNPGSWMLYPGFDFPETPRLPG